MPCSAACLVWEERVHDYVVIDYVVLVATGASEESVLSSTFVALGLARNSCRFPQLQAYQPWATCTVRVAKVKRLC